MIVVRREQGRLDELVEATQSFVARYPQFPGWRCGLAYVYAHLGCTEQARHELEALARDDFCDLPRDTFWLSSLVVLCDVVVFLGDVPRAHLLYQLLLPYANRCAVIYSLCQGSVARPLGLLATITSRYADAETHFTQALRMNAQIRSPLWRAYTEHDYARMLLLRNRFGDHNKALHLLKQALATAEQLGLKALADKVRPLLSAEELRDRDARPATGPEAGADSGHNNLMLAGVKLKDGIKVTGDDNAMTNERVAA
jgi:tetratricopeptide (TPR) repeat protein